MTNLDIIRAACIKANPEIETRKMDFFDEEEEKDTWVQDHTIRLADVLLAIHAQGEKELAEGKIPLPMQSVYGKIAIKWNPLKDDITLQTQETQDFIADLLK